MNFKRLPKIDALVRIEDLVLLAILAAIFENGLYQPFSKCTMALLVCSGILIRSWSLNKWFWALCSLCYVPQLIFEYDSSANHVFLLFFLCLGCFCIRWERPEDQEVAQKKCAVWLLVVVLLFATIHKFLSSYYLSGLLLTDYVMKGSSLEYLGSLFYSDWKTLTQKNLQAFTFLQATYVEGMQRQAYFLFPYMRDWLNVLAWIGVLVEGALVLILPRKSSRAIWAKGSLLLVMILGIYLLRNETVFMGIVSSLAFMIMKDESKPFANVFLFLALMFYALTVCDWRPFFLL